MWLFLIMSRMVDFCSLIYNAYELFYIDCVVGLHNIGDLHIFNYARNITDILTIPSIRKCFLAHF